MPEPNKSGVILGEGIEKIGKQVKDAADAIGAIQQKKREAQASADALLMFTDQARKADKALEDMKINADHEHYADKALEALNAIGNEGQDKLKDPLAKAAFNRRWLEHHLTSYNGALKWQTQLYHKFQEGALATYFNDTFHRAMATDQATAYRLISMTVQDAYDMANFYPEMAATIEKATEHFIKTTIGGMMRRAEAQDPDGFIKSGPERWKDRVVPFTDSKGRQRSFILGPDPNLEDALRKRAQADVVHEANRKSSLQRQMEKEIEDTATKAITSWESDMWDVINNDPGKGMSIVNSSDFRGRSAIAVGVLGEKGIERMQKLRDALMAGAVEGRDSPGQADNARFELALGNLDQDGIVGWPGLSNKTRASLMKELKSFRKEDDIVHMPAYSVNVQRIRGALSGGGLERSLLGPPTDKEAKAVWLFFERAHKPGVKESDLNKIAVEVIQTWRPGWKPELEGPTRPTPKTEAEAEKRVDASRKKVKDAGGSGPGIDDLPKNPVQGERATDANGQDYRFDGTMWRKERK